MEKFPLLLAGFLVAALVFWTVSAYAQHWSDVIPCGDGEKKPCGSNIGACESGESVCMGGQWGPCLGGTKPQNEICDDGIDNDCDGVADECVDFVGSFGLILISGGVMLMILALVLSRVFK